MKSLIAFIILQTSIYLQTEGCSLTSNSNTQIDSTQTLDTSSSSNIRIVKQLIIPTSLTTFGLITMSNHNENNINQFIKRKIRANNSEKIHVDDYIQYAPTIGFLGLEYMGLKPKNNFTYRMQTGITAHILMGATVLLMKKGTKVMRPDNSSRNSFPSGHTAMAFVGAELLWQEYHHDSPWYGVAGYTLATATGILRMYNNRHWLSDVAMGAGIGILSGKIAYWISPIIHTKLFSDKNSYRISPYYDGRFYSLKVNYSFK